MELKAVHIDKASNIIGKKREKSGDSSEISMRQVFCEALHLCICTNMAHSPGAGGSQSFSGYILKVKIKAASLLLLLSILALKPIPFQGSNSAPLLRILRPS